jgi:hypothetical protein
VFINGDGAEFGAVSSHPKHPESESLFRFEVDYCNARLDELRSFLPSSRIVLIEGNHCFRFLRYIRDKCPELYGLRGLTVPELFFFDEREGFDFVPYGPGQLTQCGESSLFLRHEPVSGGKNHSKQTAEKFLVDLAYGHTHTTQSYTHKKMGPVPRLNTAYALPWLGDSSQPCFNYRGPKDDWAEGFSVECFDTTTGARRLDIIEFRDGVGMYMGRSYGL